MGSEIDQVLANWIEQANSPIGSLPEGTNPAGWVAKRFLSWWKSRVEEPLNAAECATECVREELERLGGWKNDQLGEAMHELAHANESLLELRHLLGLEVKKRR